MNALHWSWYITELKDWRNPSNTLMKILACIVVFIILRTVVYFYDREQTRVNK